MDQEKDNEKSCWFCDAIATGTFDVILSKKKSNWLVNSKLVQISCCDRCKAVLNKQRKYIMKAKLKSFFSFLIIGEALLFIGIPADSADIYLLCAIIAVLAWLLSDFMHLLFFQHKFGKLLRENFKKEGMKNIEDNYEIHGLLNNGYIMHRFY